MKKLNLIMALLVLFGCTKKAEVGNAKELLKDVKKKYKIVTIVKIDGIAWFARMREGVHQFANETGHTATLTGPTEAKAELQIAHIEQAIKDGADAIAVVPFNVEALEPVLKKAREKGIVVIAHEASNMKNADYIIEAFQNIEYGSHLMDHLAKLMNYKGKYIGFVGSKDSRTHMEWQLGAEIRQREKYPNISREGDYIESKDNHSIAYTQTVKALKKNRKINGILGSPMSTAPGAGLAIEELGLKDKVSIVSTSLVTACSRYLESGSVDLISFWDPSKVGYIMNLMAVMALEKMEFKNGMNFRVDGYTNVQIDKRKKNLFYGAGWTDVTKKNMHEYTF
ncbi:hypothetical protein A9Q84_00495 [Halobacteriovorax marinus]|uniref:Periplasmic binding protein domain-containing protein n=1 Tax=Halobacteriovorax marinus TaxID=97084 RepID=A0A1Y5FBF6_9BACT|nr:hypothetical protein A9Q84_00495 [Halobacteriovorax marinus]